MKPFVYMIQAESDMPYPNLPDENNDIMLLTWKRPSNEPNATFYPESSWNQGRNKLLHDAISHSKKTGNPYLYYIFLDEDCVVKEDAALAAELGIPLTGNPFRTFERYLMQWQPAVGYTRYSWQYYETGKEMNLGYNFDALFNAFHREALSFLLPYYTGFDSMSWLYSQNIVNHLTAILFNSYRIQFNVITTKNNSRRGYNQREKIWSIPTRFLLEAIKTDLKHQMNTENPNTIYPNPGEPLKKDRPYAISSSFVKKHFDVRHSFIQSRRFLMPENITVHGLP
jgi:hypothetical protein